MGSLMMVQPPAQALVPLHPVSHHRGERASTNQAGAVWHHHDRASHVLVWDVTACLSRETTIPETVMDPVMAMDPVMGPVMGLISEVIR